MSILSSKFQISQIQTPKFSTFQPFKSDTQKQLYNPQTEKSKRFQSQPNPNKSLLITQAVKGREEWKSKQKEKGIVNKNKLQSIQLENIDKKYLNRKEIKSWADLEKLKNKYKCELLKRKSKEEIVKENLTMIERIEQSPPKVETWNNYKAIKTPRKSQSELLLEKNMEIVKRIEETSPKVETWNFYKRKPSQRKMERIDEKYRILQQNIKLILRVEDLQPRVDCWSQRKNDDSRAKLRVRSQQKFKLLQQNMRLIQKVQSTPPKIEDWANLTQLRNKVKKEKLSQRSSMAKLEQMKKTIQETEQKLRRKQLDESNKLRKSRSAPSKISPRLQKYRSQCQKSLKRMQMKIQNTKCSIDCWSKPLPKIKISNKTSPPSHNTNNKKNGTVLGLVKRIQMLNQMQRNQQIKVRTLSNLQQTKNKEV